MPEETRHIGQVKFFNVKRGFGFVEDVESKEAYFLHFSEINPSTNVWKVVHENEFVEFSIVDGTNGKQCENVTGIKGLPMICQSQYDIKRKRPFSKDYNPHKSTQPKK